MNNQILALNFETQFTDILTFQKILLSNCDGTGELIKLLHTCAIHLLEAHDVTALNVLTKNYGAYAEPAYMCALFNATLTLTALTKLETAN